jgi:hypothetical protein
LETLLNNLITASEPSVWSPRTDQRIKDG